MGMGMGMCMCMGMCTRPASEHSPTLLAPSPPIHPSRPLTLITAARRKHAWVSHVHVHVCECAPPVHSRYCGDDSPGGSAKWDPLVSPPVSPLGACSPFAPAHSPPQYAALHATAARAHPFGAAWLAEGGPERRAPLTHAGCAIMTSNGEYND